MKKNIAVFASHGGSDLQAIIDGCAAGKIDARVCAVISNNSGSRALERAREANIPAFHVSEKKFPQNFDKKIYEILREYKTDIVFLAGYLKKMPDNILCEYDSRIFNIHPSLLPKFGGKGMFGINVHAAVLAAGETET
ncbi:MAG: phosphoribosylglycinamide formyltransferase, partial [Defluviitaleaceae bacterium]|nr:phosphoribosylglycinamide formyltransferase [Defluviitaleaceae bacterium]